MNMIDKLNLYILWSLCGPKASTNGTKTVWLKCSQNHYFRLLGAQKVVLKISKNPPRFGKNLNFVRKSKCLWLENRAVASIWGHWHTHKIGVWGAKYNTALKWLFWTIEIGYRDEIRQQKGCFQPHLFQTLLLSIIYCLTNFN